MSIGTPERRLEAIKAASKVFEGAASSASSNYDIDRFKGSILDMADEFMEYVDFGSRR